MVGAAQSSVVIERLLERSFGLVFESGTSLRHPHEHVQSGSVHSVLVDRLLVGSDHIRKHLQGSGGIPQQRLHFGEVALDRQGKKMVGAGFAYTNFEASLVDLSRLLEAAEVNVGVPDSGRGQRESLHKKKMSLGVVRWRLARW